MSEDMKLCSGITKEGVKTEVMFLYNKRGGSEDRSVVLV